jgi:signal transduction histidine kinase
MLRHKEIRIFIAILCIIALASILPAALYAPSAVLYLVIASVLFISTALSFTYWRYRQIAKLSNYLRQIAGGDYGLDVRDHVEGELSILKADIYKLTIRLSEQTALLQQDKRKLTDAISDISHQLNTPLTSMMVMSDLLNQDHLPADKRAEFARNIRVQLERIEWLVSSLLKLSKIDAGTVAFKKEEIPLMKLLDKALAPVLIPMDIKEQQLIVEGDESAVFRGDMNWTAEAIINLLKNSVEHTPAGGKIHIAFAENPLYAEIKITDNGAGIAKEDLPYIFKRFYKGKNAGEGSIGIGLAMANSIISSQQGTIEVKSDKGAGTQFHIKFFKGII